MYFAWQNTCHQFALRKRSMETWRKLSVETVSSFFLEWLCKSWFQTRNPVPGPASSTLISLFHNQRNSSLIAYFKSHFKATQSDFWPHCSLPYYEQCIVQRLLRFTAAIKKSHSISSSWAFFVIHTADKFWGLLHYQDGCITERVVNNITNQ